MNQINKKVKYREVVKYKNGYKVVNLYPMLTEEENEKRKEDILIGLYHHFKYQNTKDNRV